MKSNRNVFWRRIATIVLVSLMTLASNLSAGAYTDEVIEGEKQQVEVSLHGVTRFGAVQLFDYLLEQRPEIVVLQQTRSLVTADEPAKCRVDWTVEITDGTGAEILQELRSIINDLDTETQNDILYDAPFVVMKEDLELLKRVVPVESGAAYAVFAIEGELINAAHLAAVPRNTTIPWYQGEDAGFE